MALRQVDKRQLNSGLKGLGLNLSDSQLGSIAKLGGSEALRNLVDSTYALAECSQLPTPASNFTASRLRTSFHELVA